MQIQRLRVEGGRTYLGRPAIGLGIKTEEREIAPDPVTGVSRGRSAKVPRIQLHEPQAAEEAPGAESGGAVQGASSRTHKPDAGYQPRPYGPGPRGISPRMDRILRSMVWNQWKRGTTRYRELRQRGIAAQDAAQTAGSSDGPWHLANTPVLKIALSNAYFASLGLPKLTAH